MKNLWMMFTLLDKSKLQYYDENCKILKYHSIKSVYFMLLCKGIKKKQTNKITNGHLSLMHIHNKIRKKCSWQLLSSYLNGSCVCSCYLQLTSFITPLCFNKHLAGYTSFPGSITQPFIHEWSWPLAVLSGLDCCSFLLSLTTGHDNTKKHSQDLVSQTSTSLPLLWNSHPISPGSQDQYPSHQSNAFLTCWFTGTRNPKWLERSLHFWFNWGFIMFCIPM